MDGLTVRFVGLDRPTSASSRARRRRWAKFTESFPDITEMRVLDLGGTPEYWLSAPQKPEHLTVINLVRFDSSDAITAVQGDACNPPADILSQHFDLVYSNSVLEHVGGHGQRARLAEVVHTAAERHWVQTPYRYFPIEPHWLAPGIQFLPFEAKVRATMLWKFGYMHTTDREIAVDHVNEVELLGLTQMRNYFPGSELWAERYGGLIKSVVAIRS